MAKGREEVLIYNIHTSYIWSLALPAHLLMYNLEPGAGRAHVVGGLVPRVQELPPALHQK